MSRICDGELLEGRPSEAALGRYPRNRGDYETWRPWLEIDLGIRLRAASRRTFLGAFVALEAGLVVASGDTAMSLAA